MTQFSPFPFSTYNGLVVRDSDRGLFPLTDVFAPVDPAEVIAQTTAAGYPDATVRQGNVLLIDTGREKLLFDCGLPAERGGQLTQNLRAAGIDPSAIDAIIMTHGDGDHIGGLTLFPNARLIIPKRSWMLWTENLDEMVEEFVAIFRGQVPEEQLSSMATGRRQLGKMLQSQAERVETVEFEAEFRPGFRFLPAPGHRSDHAAVEITAGAETLLHVADAFRHPLQMKHPWPSWIDSYPEQAVATAQTLFARAAGSDALVFGAHLPFPGLVRIGREGDTFTWTAIDPAG